MKGMKPTCKLFEKAESQKAFLVGQLAKSGEGAGLQKVRQQKQQNWMCKKAEDKYNSVEKLRKAFEDSPLHVCNERCLRTK